MSIVIGKWYVTGVTVGRLAVSNQLRMLAALLSELKCRGEIPRHRAPIPRMLY